jgi:tRNA nucleotidyltransferase (CCA-adding enzyme)
MDEILDIWPGSPVLGRPPAVTVIVLSRGCRIDVSTFQGKDLEEDLGRRDLTINAMAMVPDGTIIDPWGGRSDLAGRLLRFTGDPVERLIADPLRAVRIARFVSELPGFRVGQGSLKTCREFASRVAVMPLPRIGREVLHALEGDLPAFLETLEQGGILDPILPCLKGLSPFQRDQVFSRIRNACALTADPAVRAATLLADEGTTVTGTLSAWNWPNSLSREISALVENLTVALDGCDVRTWARLFRSRGADWIGKLSLLGFIFSLNSEPDTGVWVQRRVGSIPFIVRLQSFGQRITGEEVMALTGLESGPEIGRIMDDLDEAVALGEVRNREDALKWVSSAGGGHLGNSFSFPNPG